MHYIPSLAGVDQEHRDRARQMAEPLTPRSERPRESYGSLEISLQTSIGLCSLGRKCVKKQGHGALCWPQD